MLGREVQNRINQLNPWISNRKDFSRVMSDFIPAIYVKRDLEDMTVFSDRAFLVIGPRQAGKSTMIWHQLSKYGPDVLFLNMEDPLLRSLCDNAADFVSTFRGHYHFIRAIFIDEIQHMLEAGLFVKGLVDAKLNVPIWVSGSSSFELLSKTRESLAGRAVRRRLMPFSVLEILNYQKPANPIEKERVSTEVVAHSMIYGNYPAVYLADSNDHKTLFLGDLVDALILRDASDLFRIKRIDAFRKLLTLLAGQIGNLLNMSELASLCGVDIGTIHSYIEILEESHIVKRIRPFAEGKRREITGTPKVFFIDKAFAINY
ncbi:MAG: ATP-binding protein [SAR324 cluster bacterium]|nr:ATP-binding protein [SAR324 cluster bacterium]